MIAFEVRFTRIEHKSADFSHQKGKQHSQSQNDGLQALDSPKRSVDGFRYQQILSQLDIFRVDQISSREFIHPECFRYFRSNWEEIQLRQMFRVCCSQLFTVKSATKTLNAIKNNGLGR